MEVATDFLDIFCALEEGKAAYLYYSISIVTAAVSQPNPEVHTGQRHNEGPTVSIFPLSSPSAPPLSSISLSTHHRRQRERERVRLEPLAASDRTFQMGPTHRPTPRCSVRTLVEYDATPITSKLGSPLALLSQFAGIQSSRYRFRQDAMQALIAAWPPLRHRS